MVSPNVRVFPKNTQVPPIVSELEAIFEELPDEALIDKLRGPRRRGRPSYDPSKLWRAFVVRYYMGLPSVSDLIRTLYDNPYVAAACGFASPDEIPHQSTFSRFMTKLSKKPYANMVREVSREMTRRCYESLPDFGKAVAVDSTDLKAWSNKAKKPTTDPDAGWAVKSSSGNLKKYWLGYKAHILVDVAYELPLAISVTSANVHDAKAAPALLRQARRICAFRPDYIALDAGYSTKALRRHIREQYWAEPIIKAAKTSRKWLELETAEWKMKYNTRVSVERVISRLKEHRAFNHVRVRRIQKVRTHCYLSTAVMQAQALATESRASVRKVA